MQRISKRIVAFAALGVLLIGGAAPSPRVSTAGSSRSPTRSSRQCSSSSGARLARLARLVWLVRRDRRVRLVRRGSPVASSSPSRRTLLRHTTVTTTARLSPRVFRVSLTAIRGAFSGLLRAANSAHTALVGVHRREREIVGDAAAALDANRAVDHIERHVRRRDQQTSAREDQERDCGARIPSTSAPNHPISGRYPERRSA
jgi:hypothetical protein